MKCNKLTIDGQEFMFDIDRTVQITAIETIVETYRTYFYKEFIPKKNS